MQNNERFFAVLLAVTLVVGAMIGWGIITTQATAHAVSLSLEKGQNPLYAKCALENSPTCRDMITAMALSGQFKDSTAPVHVPIPAQNIPVIKK